MEKKYIDANKLIDKINNSIAYCQINYSDDYGLGFGHALDEIKDFVMHLLKERSEVDLEKEIQEHIKGCLDVKLPTTDIKQIKQDVAYTARKFYELGLNARKEK